MFELGIQVRGRAVTLIPFSVDCASVLVSSAVSRIAASSFYWTSVIALRSLSAPQGNTPRPYLRLDSTFAPTEFRFFPAASAPPASVSAPSQPARSRRAARASGQGPRAPRIPAAARGNRIRVAVTSPLLPRPRACLRLDSTPSPRLDPDPSPQPRRHRRPCQLRHSVSTTFHQS